MIVSQTPNFTSSPVPIGACSATYACLTAKSDFPVERGDWVENVFASGPASKSTLYPALQISAGSIGFSSDSLTTFRLKPSALLVPPKAYGGKLPLPLPMFHCADVST